MLWLVRRDRSMMKWKDILPTKNLFPRWHLRLWPIPLWNVDSYDWKDYGVDAILKNVLENENLGNGSIIRCHSGARYMADALDSLIKGLEKQGYEIVPVSRLIYEDKYHMKEDGRQVKN